MFSWIDLDTVAKWTGAQWPSTPIGKRHVFAVSTDTRTLAEGELFWAIQGPNFDGHDYVEAAREKGAVAAVVQRPVKSPLAQMVVPDTTRALVTLGAEIRRAFKGPVVGITGSAGKSSTKQMLGDLLGPECVRSPKSFNNILGVPRTLCLLKDTSTHAVLEIGMNALGEIAEITQHFKPSYGLITNIGDAHIGKLGSQEAIYTAKKELFDSLVDRGPESVILNLDDPLVVRAFEAVFPGKTPGCTYSLANTQADVRVTSRQVDPFSGGLRVQVQIREQSARLELGLFGLHQAQNIAAASAAALAVGLSAEVILERLSGLKSTSQRGELIGLSEGRTLIDESYNSNPSALVASLSTVAQLDPSRRRVLVLGEMLELEGFGEALHSRAGQALVQLYKAHKFPFLLVGVGNGFLPFIREVEQALPGVPCVAVPDAGQAIARMKALLLPGDIVLVKGSRGTALDQVVDWLKIG